MEVDSHKELILKLLMVPKLSIVQACQFAYNIKQTYFSLPTIIVIRNIPPKNNFSP